MRENFWKLSLTFFVVFYRKSLTKKYILIIITVAVGLNRQNKAREQKMKEKNTQINLILNAESLGAVHTYTHTANSKSLNYAIFASKNRFKKEDLHL